MIFYNNSEHIWWQLIKTGPQLTAKIIRKGGAQKKMLHIFLTLCERTKLPLHSMLIRNNPLATLILQKTRTFFGGGAKMPSQAVNKTDFWYKLPRPQKHWEKFQRKWLNDVVENAGRKSDTNGLLSSTCVVLWPPTTAARVLMHLEQYL